MKTSNASLELKAEAILGEGPVWDDLTKKLYWIDIKSQKVYRYDPVSKVQEDWHFDQMIGCISVIDENNIVCALQDRIVHFNISTGEQRMLSHIEKDQPDNRSNDGKSDPAGRLWVGTLHIPGENGKAGLYRMDSTLQLQKQVGALGMSNGLGWSPDASTMYLVDTGHKHILQFKYSIETGSISDKRLIIDLSDGDASPDGMCVDVEGKLWISFYGGSKVGRYDPSTGQLLEVIAVPAENVTCCVFGGRDFDTLYITTAREGVSDEQLKKNPDTGSIFSIKPGVKGLPSNRFRLNKNQ